MLQADDIQLVDRKYADAALRASGTTGKPSTRTLGGIRKCMIHDLHEFAVACWSARGHEVSIPQRVGTNLGVAAELQLLRSEYFDLFDRWRFRQQLSGICHEGRGDATFKVRLAATLVGEGIENSEF
jgi:hypothetical protein